MKKYTFWAIASFYFCMSVDAHNISREEYNLPTNPGYGSSTIVPTKAGIPMKDLSIGNNTISINISSKAICLTNSSLATGNWGTPGTWSCGHVPLATEPVLILLGHTVTLDVNGVGKSLNLLGTLNQQAAKTLTIQGN